MKKLFLITAMMVLAAPLYAQEDSVDVTNILDGLRNQGGNGRGRNNQFQLPDSMKMMDDIKTALKNGKTPLVDKSQEKAVRSLLDTEVVALTDKVQLLRNGNNNDSNNGNNNRGRGSSNQGNNNQGNNTQNQPSQTAITVETVTSLKNQDFIDNKLPLFLSPEQVALVKKTAADDKNNSACLGGLLDRYYNQMNSNNRGNNNNNNNNNNNQNFNRGNNNQNNNNNQSNQTRPNGQKYCMTIEAMPTDRLEPIRKVLAKANMPLAKDKESFADIAMKAELNELQDALRAALTGNNNNQNFNRGNNNNNRNGNQDPRQILQSGTDNIYKKVESTLNPPQAETLKRWRYEQVLSRGGIEALIAIEALADTPLTDEQTTKVTAAWPEYRKQIQDLARQANQNVSDKQRDNAAMNKILDTFLEPSQVASYKLALKYGPETSTK